MEPIQTTSLPGNKRSFANGVSSDPVRNHPYRPVPNPLTGELLIDPDILLKAKGFDLQIDFFYSTSATGTEYGQGRSASVHAYVVSAISGSVGAVVTAYRGNFRQYPYQK